VRFRVEAWDGLDKISEGEHERAIITPANFHERLNDKKRRAGL
jgi:fluoroacetyl-CoA thioesterase